MNPPLQGEQPPRVLIPVHRFKSLGDEHDLVQRRSGAERRRLSVQKSTEELHAANPNDTQFYGSYGHLRKCLDYQYHVHYRKERQWLHDAIIEDSLLRDDGSDDDSSELLLPTTSLWLILTVGVHGVGKHFVIQDLISSDRLRLLSFVCIDTDDVRTYLPEYSTFVQEYPDKLDTLTRKEAGYISETLTLATLHAGRNAIFFCSAKDSDWYMNTFLPKLRLQNPGLKAGMIHVTAKKDAVLCRSRRIAFETGRLVVEADVVENLDCIIPRTVDRLKSVMDYSCTIRNDGDDLELLDGGDWKKFADTFDQRNVLKPPSRLTPEQSVLHAIEHAKHSCTYLRRRSSLIQGFSVLQSSEENHKSDEMKFYGTFADIRATLDYSYHKNYTFERQRFQDAIILEFLNDAVLKDENGEVCTTPTMPWIVFTAGAFGAGKGYTLRKLVQAGRFPLMAFVRVDPDSIRRYLPEFHLYVQQSPDRAGELTNKEAGYIAEILTLAGLQAGKNVIVDGSLRRVTWYRDYFARLRKDFPTLRIAIIHVTAPREAVFQRAAERAIHTGRIVPRDLLVETLEQVPISVGELVPLVDYHIELRNVSGADDIELMTPGESWQSFTSQWTQICAWVPKSQKRWLEKSRRIERKLGGASET